MLKLSVELVLLLLLILMSLLVLPLLLVLLVLILLLILLLLLTLSLLALSVIEHYLFISFRNKHCCLFKFIFCFIIKIIHTKRRFRYDIFTRI